MKKIIILSITGILSLAMLTVCNKNNNEENNDLLMLLGLAGGSQAGTFTKTVALSSGETGGNLPFNDNYQFYHFQLLYKPGDINGSGNIKSIFFRYNATISEPGVTCSNVTIKLGHSSLDELGDLWSDMALNINQGKGSAVTVLDNATISIPAGASQDYFEIPLETPFNYNGVDSLVVDIIRTTACSDDVSMRVGNDGATLYNRAAMSTDPDNPNVSNPVREFLHHAKFKFAGGDNVAVVPNETNLGSYTPFGPDADHLKTHSLYLAAEINGSGPITGIGFPVADTATAAETYTITVRLGHTNRTELSTTFQDNFDAGSPVTVANEAAFNVPAGIPAGSYVWLPLPDKTFNYNNNYNLVVEIQCAAAATESLDLQRIITPHRRVGGNGDTGDFTSYLPGIKFRFAGGTMDVITDSGAGDYTGYVFNTSAYGRLNLYRAVELGSAGTIKSIFCRLYDASSTATSYGNYRVIIGHSDVDSLILDPAADNFFSQNTALNGTVSVPAGLVKGDWIEIPLTSPFIYDGKSNLAVWLGTTDVSGAAVTHNCIRSPADSTLYNDHMTQGLPGAATVSTPQDYKLNMMFKISR